MSSSRLRFAALSLLFTYIFFFEYLPPFSIVHIPYDLNGYHYSLFQYVMQALNAGRFPQWDPTIYCGLGLASNIQAELFYPPAWLLFAVNLGRTQMSFASLEIFLIAHVWLAFVLSFAWLRGRQLQPLACILGAGVFAFGGYTCLQLQHLGLVAGYAWFPLAFLGVDEAVRDRDWMPLWKVTAASALCLLAGYPPTWFVLVVSLAVYAVTTWRWKVIAGTALSLAVSLSLCAIQLLPVSESSAYMFREARYGAGVKEPSFFLSYLFPNYFNFNPDVSIYTNPGREFLYLGAPAVFGILFLLRRRRIREILPFVVVAVTGFVFITNPYGLVWDSIEHSSLLAEVCRAWYFLAAIPLALAPLTAYGLDDFLHRPARPLSSWLSAVALCSLTAWSGWELHVWLAGGHFASGLESMRDPAIMLIVFALAMFAVRSQKNFVRIVLAVAIVLAVGVDYKVFGTRKRFNAAPGTGEAIFSPAHLPAMDPDVYRQLKTNSEYRILLEGGPHPLELRQTGLLTPQGFDPFLPEQYRELLDGKAVFSTNREFDVDPRRKDVLQLFGVRYIITTPAHPDYPILRGDPDFRELGQGTPYYRVFEYLQAAPPFGWEHPTVGDPVKLTRWTPERRDFRVQSATGGRFLFEEQMLPGWEAKIDGQSTPIEKWNHAFQSIVVPRGEHAVEFRFRSRSLRSGAWISAFTLLGIAAALFARHTCYARPSSAS